jgi:hypothetical protein
MNTQAGRRVLSSELRKESTEGSREYNKEHLVS